MVSPVAHALAAAIRELAARRVEERAAGRRRLTLVERPKEPLEEGVPCDECGADRLRRWEEACKANGLTEADWPRPVAPRFADELVLERHRRRVHLRQ